MLQLFEESITGTEEEENGEFNFDVSKPLLSDTGYELAKTTGILNEIDFDLVFKITKYYKGQEALGRLENKLLESLLLNGIPDESGLKRLLFQLKELNRNQHELLKKMNELLGEMRNK